MAMEKVTSGLTYFDQFILCKFHECILILGSLELRQCSVQNA